MKSAARVFIIISMVLHSIGILLSIFAAEFIWVVLGITSIIVGTLALIALDNEDVSPSIAISVCTLIFCNLIAGILMLIDRKDRSCGPRSIHSNLQCDKCGKRDLAVRYYTVDSALGKMNRAFCPECKDIFDAESKNRNI